MDQLTFASNVITAVAWPMVVASAAYWFRIPISKLIPQIQKLKFKDIEADFQALSVSDQSLLFLDGVARKDQWTFYGETRAAERSLGQAFSVLVADLLKVERNELMKKLRSWLSSGQANLVWFASEIIGYFTLKELTEELRPHLPGDIHKDCLPHELNCLWAYARCTEMRELDQAFLATRSEANQKWLMVAYKQMSSEHRALAECLDILKSFLLRADLSSTARAETEKIMKELSVPRVHQS